MGFKVSVLGSIGEDNYNTTLSSGKHTIVADTPVKYGGDEEGFNPFEIMASSLASCTLITLRLYADRKKWEIPEIVVDVEVTTNPKQEITSFLVQIDLSSSQLTKAEKDRMLDIAAKCPVHRILKNNISVFSELK